MLEGFNIALYIFNIMPVSSSLSHVAVEYVSPDLLDFDPENPRFATKMTGKSQGQIQKQIYGEPYFAVELVDSFLENGFIDFEPLVVKRGGQGRFVVIEGNRRLAAIKEIRNNLTKYSSSPSSAGRFSDPQSSESNQSRNSEVLEGFIYLRKISSNETKIL